MLSSAFSFVNPLTFKFCFLDTGLEKVVMELRLLMQPAVNFLYGHSYLIGFSIICICPFQVEGVGKKEKRESLQMCIN
jgi:hypothetical protein